MAFTNLTSYTEAEYRALPNYGSNLWANKTPLQNPDSRVTVNLGFWVSPTVMAFTVMTNAAAASTVTIDNVAKTLDVDIIAAVSPTATMSYWTIDVGSDDSSGTQWTINFVVEANNTNTGTWVFTKGRPPEEDEVTPEAEMKNYSA